MTIHLDKKSGNWIADARKVIDGKQYRNKKSFDTKKEAKTFETDFYYKLENDLLNIGGNIKLSEYLDIWLAYKEPDLGKTTYLAYKYSCKSISKHLGHKKLEKLKALDVDNLLMDLRSANLSPNSIKRIYRVFFSAMKKAYIQDRIQKNFVAKVPTPKVPKDEDINPLTHQEQILFNNILNADAKPNSKTSKREGVFLTKSNYAFYKLALATGLRRGELSGLKWSDIDLDQNYLILKRSIAIAKDNQLIEKLPKNNQKRRIDLDTETINLLSEHKLFMKEYQVKNQLRFTNNWLFPNLDGEVTHINLWSNRFKSLMVRAGIQGQRLHNLRHTHISNLLSIGANLSWVSQRAGHSDISITARIYATYMPEAYVGYAQEQMDKINSKVTGS